MGEGVPALPVGLHAVSSRDTWFYKLTDLSLSLMSPIVTPILEFNISWHFYAECLSQPPDRLDGPLAQPEQGWL